MLSWATRPTSMTSSNARGISALLHPTVRNTIPRISNASVVVALRQGVRDEKKLEKLATYDI
jgi:hypothetical protein